MKLFRYRKPSLKTIVGITTVKKSVKRNLGIARLSTGPNHHESNNEPSTKLDGTNSPFLPSTGRLSEMGRLEDHLDSLRR